MFSIIIPTYNSDSTIDRCLSSVLCQSFEDFEAIIVDDGSKDNCFQICQNYASADERIRVQRITHSGVSAARQFGLSIAKGDWIVFLDSDDYLPNNALQIFSGYINRDDHIDIVVGNYSVDNEGMVSPTEYHFASVESYIYQFLSFGDVNTSLWGKSIRRRILLESKLSFVNGLDICEDYLFLAKLFLHTNKIALIPENVYFWTVGAVSCLTRSRFTDFSTKTRVLSLVEQLYRSHNKVQFLPAINRAKFVTLMMFEGARQTPGLSIVSKPPFSVSIISNRGLSKKEVVIKFLLMFGLRRMAIKLYS